MPESRRSFITLYKEDKAIFSFERLVICSTVSGRRSFSKMLRRDNLGFVTEMLLEARIDRDNSILVNLLVGMLPL